MLLHLAYGKQEMEVDMERQMQKKISVLCKLGRFSSCRKCLDRSMFMGMHTHILKNVP